MSKAAKDLERAAVQLRIASREREQWRQHAEAASAIVRQVRTALGLGEPGEGATMSDVAREMVQAAMAAGLKARRDAVVMARGCTDYGGGYHGQEYQAFQDGIGTVVAVLERWAEGEWDSQLAAVWRVGVEVAQ